MEVTVIIPCGRPERLPSLLAALQNQSLRPTTVVVVSATANLQADGFELIRTTVLYPPGHMRNLGAACAKTALLAFIDDDCLPPPDWLAKILPCFDDVTVGGTGCRVVAARNSFWNRCSDYALFNCYQAYKGRGMALGSAALVVRLAAFKQAGGFDELLTASEDWDFSLKLQEAGWRCLFVPAVEVRHDHGRVGFMAILRQSFLSGRKSELTVVRRHYQQMSWLARLSVMMEFPVLYL